MTFGKVRRLWEKMVRRQPPTLKAWYTAIYQRGLGTQLTDYGKSNRVEIAFGRTSRLKITFMGNHNVVRIGLDSRLSSVEMHVVGSNNVIEIDAGCIIDRAFFWITESESRIRVGPDTFFQESRIFLTDRGTEVVLGRDCMIANGSELRCGDGHTVFDIGTREILNRAKYIILGDRVWLASRVFVLKNVEIGEGCVLGAGSIVTRDIAANCLAAGIPAKVLRRNISWRKENIDGLPREWAKLSSTIEVGSPHHDSRTLP